MHQMPRINIFYIIVFTIILAFVCCFIWRLRRIYIICAALFFLTGCFVTDRKNSFLENMLPDDRQEIVLNGIICDYEVAENYIKVFLKDCFYIDKNKISVNISDLSNKNLSLQNIVSDDLISSGKNLKCLVYINKDDRVKIGDNITVTGEVSRWSSPTNKGQFDEKTYYYGLDIHFSLFADNILHIRCGDDICLQSIRNIRDCLHKNYNKITDKVSSGVFQAMLLGEKNSVDGETKKLFMDGSIGHILVVSGLHFSVAGMAVFSLSRKFLSYLSSGIISIFLLFLFGILCGFSTSSIRAFLMFAVFIGASVKGRDYDLPTSLAAAVIYILLSNPYTLFLPGFILSVSAVMGIITVVPVFSLLVKSKSKLLKAMYTSLGIQIFTLPVSLFYFFNFNPYSLILNAAVLPLMPVVLVCGIISGMFSFFLLGVSKILIMPGSLILKYINGLCLYMQSLPFYNIFPGKPSFSVCILYYFLLILIIFIYNRKEVRKKYWIVFFLALPSLFFIHRKVPLSIEMLDVGQGLCVFVKTEDGARILYDGGSTDLSEVGKYRIIPFLKADGSIVLDAVFVSHLDRDHISGIVEIISDKSVKIKTLYLPKTSFVDKEYKKLEDFAKNNGVKVAVFGDGNRLVCGKLKIDGIHPSKDFITVNRNDTSIIMRLEYNGGGSENSFSMLFCGDMEQAAQSRILHNRRLLDTEVLVAAHHGSGYTTSEEFLDKIKPKVTLISCGEQNKYGHPHAELIERLENVYSKIFITMKCGAVNINYNDGRYIVQSR